MEEFALIKSRVNLNRVNLGIALISDLKVSREKNIKNRASVQGKLNKLLEAQVQCFFERYADT